MGSQAENPLRPALLALLPVAETGLATLKDEADSARTWAQMPRAEKAFVDNYLEALGRYDKALGAIEEAKRLLRVA